MVVVQFPALAADRQTTVPLAKPYYKVRWIDASARAWIASPGE